jgi:putative flavoprotein involved in K+ transport
VTVDRLARSDDGFEVSSGATSLRADNVIVAMGNHQVPWRPTFADELDPSIAQLHANDYRNPAQLADGDLLVVGVGNSGAEIALDVRRGDPGRERQIWLAGKESGAVPFRLEPFIARNVLVRVVRFVGHHILTVRTPIGRRLRPKLLRVAAPLVRVKRGDFPRARVQRVPRVVGVRDGLPILGDGRVVDVANVVWCTGYRPGFSWIDLPILGDRQEPAHARGVVETVPGLYFVGLHFLYAMTSDTITGMQRDAKRIASQLASRSSTHERRAVVSR